MRWGRPQEECPVCGRCTGWGRWLPALPHRGGVGLLMCAAASPAACCHPPLQLYHSGLCCYAGPCLPAKLRSNSAALETACVIMSRAYQWALGRQLIPMAPTTSRSCTFLWPCAFPAPILMFRGCQAYLRAESITCDGGQAQPYFLPGSEHFTTAQAADLPLQVPMPIGPLPDLDTAAICNRTIPSLRT